MFGDGKRISLKTGGVEAFYTYFFYSDSGSCFVTGCYGENQAKLKSYVEVIRQDSSFLQSYDHLKAVPIVISLGFFFLGEEREKSGGFVL